MFVNRTIHALKHSKEHPCEWTRGRTPFLSESLLLILYLKWRSVEMGEESLTGVGVSDRSDWSDSEEELLKG